MGQQYPEEVDALVLPWLRRHTKAEIEEIANRFQLTIAPLRTIAEVLATPQLASTAASCDPSLRWADAAGARDCRSRSRERRAPEAPDVAPTMLDATRREAAERQASGGRLAGLRVLDLGWVWSAPQTGSILAQFGAEVIKVEHSKRLDNARLSGTDRSATAKRWKARAPRCRRCSTRSTRASSASR